MSENPSAGPWWVLEGDTACIVNARETIARCVRFVGHPYIHRANARMIAAAPEMLAALIEVQDMFEAHYRDVLGITDLDVIPGTPAYRVRAAIAKATGGQP